VPFNISIPWDIQISNFLNIPINELKTNYKKDINLQPMIQSTCSMIRDYSIKQIFTQGGTINNVIQIKELCYGRG